MREKSNIFFWFGRDDNSAIWERLYLADGKKMTREWVTHAIPFALSVSFFSQSEKKNLHIYLYTSLSFSFSYKHCLSVHIHSESIMVFFYIFLPPCSVFCFIWLQKKKRRMENINKEKTGLVISQLGKIIQVHIHTTYKWTTTKFCLFVFFSRNNG